MQLIGSVYRHRLQRLLASEAAVLAQATRVLLAGVRRIGACDANLQREPFVGDSLGELLLRLMQDARSDQTNRLFRELWAIALHDPRVAKAMDSFYTRSANAYLRRARHESGTISGGGQLEGIIYLMLVISEGVSVIFGTRPTADRLFDRVRDAARRAIIHLHSRGAGVEL
jgi:hypothetical protein